MAMDIALGMDMLGAADIKLGATPANVEIAFGDQTPSSHGGHCTWSLNEWVW